MPTTSPHQPPPPPQEVQVKQVLFSLRWRVMCQILLALPVIGIFVCLITSMIFHSDHINNTVCKVYNFLPSISAVTGVSPQRYLWRVAVALHISPRLLVAFVSKSHYESLGCILSPPQRPAYQSLVRAAFYLNLVELGTLCGVTYISNKENYPVHEKFFTLFMLVS
ncbi:post-GPI attachment to proteins factor 2-like, partial [Hyalella azteca]|uniref:Post-GPI attachment to proteins factor 2-like n=1 Tax=Hyalella azteca TaxID=294128 RepID=A0A8B7NED5_HYAAZ